MELKEIIGQLHNYGNNDPLVHLNCTSVKFFRLEKNTNTYVWSKVRAILKESENYFKESGIHTLCACHGTFEIDHGDKQQIIPIWIQPLRYKRNKIHDEVQFHEDSVGFLNPYLEKWCTSSFDLIVPAFENSDAAMAYFQQMGKGRIHQEFTYLGNFHPYRHDLIRDVELIHQVGSSELVNALLEGSPSLKKIDTPPLVHYLFEADSDQKKALHSVFSQPATVIQGPPGTGKSQVIAGIAGNAILNGQRLLISSQKRAALEVIRQKLEALGLGDLCFIATSQTQAKELIFSLKECWLQLEQRDIRQNNNLFISENLHDQLQYKLDVFHKDGLIGGISLRDFMACSKEVNLSEIPYFEDLPVIQELRHQETAVRQIYSDGLHTIVGKLVSTIYDERIIGGIQKEVISLQHEWALLEEFGVRCLEDLYARIQLSVSCQELNSPFVGPYVHLYRSGSKEQRAFLRLEKKWNQVYPNFLICSEENKHWKVRPTSESLDSIERLLSKKSLFSSYRIAKKWKEYSFLPSSHPLRTIEKARKFIQLEEEVTRIRGSFSELGVYNPEQDLAILSHTIRSGKVNYIESYLNLSEKERKTLASSNARLNSCLQKTKSIFRLSLNECVANVITSCLEKLERLLINKNYLQNLTPQMLRGIAMFNSFEEFEKGIFKSDWIRFLQEFPAMKNFHESDFFTLSEKIIQEEKKEAKFLVEQIRAKQIGTYRTYETLLKKAPGKLDTKEKQFRNSLKNGKRILVKEFSKSRNHLSLQALFASDAKYWIELIHPVWLCNPILLARIFPIDMRFNIGIIDEASQVNLAHGLGLVQRSHKIVLCGDDQQMSPTSYFQSGSVEVQSIFSQALFYFPSVQLLQHYRSEHPALIQFSNQHFYRNLLKTIPTKVADPNPIEWIYLEDGIYENGKNLAESSKMVEILAKSLDKNERVGVVAFSESQIQTIQSAAEHELPERIQEAFSSDRIFFKSLENIQGDECDHILISFGYGMNTEGKFEMRFGPVNLSNGPRRLNVLFSRAKRKITFVSSVRANDFKLSDNTGVSLLRNWFLFIEQRNFTNTSYDPEIDKFHVYRKYSTELVDFVRLIKKRGW